MTYKQWLNKHFKTISRLYNGITTIYGPYIAKDGRRRVRLHNRYRRITRQYAKIKMEVKLNRRLGIDETIDHIDRNPLNDKYANLQILARKIYAAKDAIRVKILSKHKCAWCNKEIKKLTKDQRNSKDKAGPFCSRSCSGKYGAALQNGKVEILKRNKIVKKYYR